MTFKYYIVYEGGAVVGTNNKEAAEHAADDAGTIVAVIDVENNTDLCLGEVGTVPAISQQLTYSEE